MRRPYRDSVVAVPLEELASSLPEGRVVDDPDIVESYRRDQTDVSVPGKPFGVVLARSRDDVVATLRWASARRVPVVARGAGTGLAGGATAVEGCVVLSLDRMTAITELAPADQLAVVEPGVVTADLDRAAREHGLMYAPDPASYETCTIGGNLATNAGGLRCVKYGVTRDSVLGLEVVLADGRVIRTGRRTVKGVTGYDLTSLFVGSEGTLGIITEATLRLWPHPSTPPVTVAATFGSLRAAGEAVAATIRAGIQPSLMELLSQATVRAVDDWKHMGFDRDVAATLLAQSDVPHADEVAARIARVFEEAGARFVAVSEDAQESAQLLELRRLAYPAYERLGKVLTEDVCVPRSKLPDMIERIEQIADRREVRIATVAHAGDGNLHPVFIFGHEHREVPEEIWAAADEVFRSAVELGGTLTGEHGVGLLKRRWLADELGEDVLDVQRSIKAALDPLDILNPGKAI